MLPLSSCVLMTLLALPSQPADEATAAAAEQAGRLREAFSLYVAAYQALPDPPPPADDSRLRERIIKLAARLDPPPELPEDAQRYAARATVMFEEASSIQDYVKAASEMRLAIRRAPWQAPFAFNLAIIEEKCARLRSALAELKLYLASSPADAVQARSKLFALEYKAERQAERLKPYTAGHIPSAEEGLALYLEACDNDVPRGCTDLGILHLDGDVVARDLNRAHALFERGCGSGDSKGCLMLARERLGSDPADAHALYEKACQGGLPVACLELGHLYEKGSGSGDFARSLELFERACNGGLADPCLDLATRHEKGRGVAKDRSRAAALFGKACDAGSSWGCNRARKLK